MIALLMITMGPCFSVVVVVVDHNGALSLSHWITFLILCCCQAEMSHLASCLLLLLLLLFMYEAEQHTPNQSINQSIIDRTIADREECFFLFKPFSSNQTTEMGLSLYCFACFGCWIIINFYWRAEMIWNLNPIKRRSQSYSHSHSHTHLHKAYNGLMGAPIIRLPSWANERLSVCVCVIQRWFVISLCKEEEGNKKKIFLISLNEGLPNQFPMLFFFLFVYDSFVWQGHHVLDNWAFARSLASSFFSPFFL